MQKLTQLMLALATVCWLAVDVADANAILPIQRWGTSPLQQGTFSPAAGTSAQSFVVVDGIGVAVALEFSSTVNNQFTAIAYNASRGSPLWQTSPMECPTVSLVAMPHEVAVVCGQEIKVFAAATGVVVQQATPYDSYAEVGTVAPVLVAAATAGRNADALLVAVNSNQTAGSSGTILYDTGRGVFLPRAVNSSCSNASATVSKLHVVNRLAAYFQLCSDGEVMLIFFPRPGVRPLPTRTALTQNMSSSTFVSSEYDADAGVLLVAVTDESDAVLLSMIVVSGASPAIELSVEWTVQVAQMESYNMADSITFVVVAPVVILSSSQSPLQAVFLDNGTEAWSNGWYSLGIVRDVANPFSVYCVNADNLLYVVDALSGYYTALPASLWSEGNLIAVTWTNLSLVVVPETSGANQFVNTTSTIMFVYSNAIEFVSTETNTTVGRVTLPSQLNGVGQLQVTASGIYTATYNAACCFSTTVGWAVSNWQQVVRQGTVAFAVVSTDNTITAIDRNGQQLWVQPTTLSTPEAAATLVPFGNRMVLTIDDNNAVVVYDTFTGSLLATIRISTDCFSNTSTPTPSISSITLSGDSRTGYFVAGLPCLFTILPDLTLTSTPTPWSMSGGVVLDEQNKVAYVGNGVELFAVPIMGGESVLVPTFIGAVDDSITSVVPSSATLATPHSVPSTLVYVVTSTGVSAFSTSGNLLAWQYSAMNLQSVAFYNNSMYTLSQSGICMLSLEPTAVSPALHAQWCHGAYSVIEATTVSNIAISPGGVLYFALDSNLYAINTLTAAAEWSLSGYVTVPAAYSCLQLTFLNELYVLVAMCATQEDMPVAVVYDAALPPHAVLMSIQLGSIGYLMSVSYTAPSLFFTSETSTAGVVVPDWIINRFANGQTTPPRAATAPPSPNTAAPGATSVPSGGLNPSPNGEQPVYPSNQTFVLPPTPLIETISAGYSNMATAVQGTLDVFPSVIFTSPHFNASIDSVCVVSATNISASPPRTIWTTNFAGADYCNANDPMLVLAGSTERSASLVLLYSGAVYVYAAATGAPLWNSSVTYSGVACSMVQWASRGDSRTPVVVCVTATDIYGFDVSNGNLVFQLLNKVAVASGFNSGVLVPFRGNTSDSIGIVGSNGLQVVQVPFSLEQNASTVFVTTYGTSSLCGSSALFATSEQSSVAPSALAYAACIGGIDTSAAIIFAVDVTQNDTYSIITNISLALDNQATNNIVTLTTEMSTEGDESMWLYFATGVSVYQQKLTSGLVATGSPIRTSGFWANPAFISPVGPYLLVWGSDPSATFVLKANGTIAAFIQTDSDYENFPQIVSCPPAVLVEPHIVVAGLTGIFAFNLSSQSVLWSVTADAVARSMAVGPPPPAAVGVAPASILVTVTFHSSYDLIFGSFLASTAAVDCTPATTILFPPAGGMIGLYSESGSNLMTDFSTWTRWSKAGAPVVVGDDVLITQSTVGAYSVETGNLTGHFIPALACPMTSTSSISFVASVSSAVLYIDDYCLYKVGEAQPNSPQSLSMSAVLLSSSVTFGTSVAVSADQSVVYLTSSNGIVVAVDVASMGIIWMSDLPDLQGFQAPTVQSLPYASSVPASQQQVVLIAQKGCLGLSANSGALLWLTVFNSTWLASLTGFAVSLTADGSMILVAGTNVVKLSLEMTEPVSRALWITSVPQIAANNPSAQWTCAAHVPNSNVFIGVISFESVLYGAALNEDSGEWLWVRQIVPGSEVQELSTATFVWKRGQQRSSAPPVYVELSDPGVIVSVEIATGLMVWMQSETTLPLPSRDSNNGLLINVEEFWCPMVAIEYATSPLLPAVTATPPPVVPPGYTFSLPLPSFGPAPEPQEGPFSPLVTWQYNTQTDYYVDATQTGFPTTMDGTQVYLMLNFNGSSYDNTSATLDAVDTLTGDAVATIPAWSARCFTQFMTKMGASPFAVLICGSDPYSIVYSERRFIFAVVDTSTAALPIKALFRVNSEDYLYTSDWRPVTTSASAGGVIGCITSEDVVFCVAGDASMKHAVMFNYSCEPQTSMFGKPVYVPSADVLIVSCTPGGTPGYNASIVALHGRNGSVAWALDYLDVSFQLMHLDPSQSFGSVMLQPLPYANEQPSQNYSIESFWYSDGTILCNVSVENVEASAFAVMQHASSDPADPFMVAMVESTQITTLIVNTSFDVVSTTTTPVVGLSSQATSIFARNATTGEWVGYVAISGYQANTVFGFVVSTSEILINSTFPLNDYYAGLLNVELIGQNRATLALSNVQGGLTCINLETAQVVLSAESSSTGVMTAGVGLVYASDANATTPGLLDVVSSRGSITQYVVQPADADRRPPKLLNHFSVVEDSSEQPSAHYIVASQGSSTFLLSYNGTTLWGTSVNDGTSGVHYFDPVIFETSSFEKVLLKSAEERTYYGYSLQNGSLLYAGSLPLCRGQGSASGGQLMAVADASALYVVVGNACLYRVDANGGAAAQAAVAEAPLAPVLVISQSCVLTCDTFGTLTCTDHSSGAQLQKLWSFSTGYTSSGTVRLLADQGLVFLHAGSTLYCLTELSGTLLWQLAVGARATMTLFDNRLLVLSRAGLQSVSLDLSAQQRIRWTTPASALGMSSGRLPPATPAPIVASNGFVIVTVYNYITALSPTTGAVMYQVAASQPCSALVAAPESAAGVSNIFFATCGSMTVRSVQSGRAIAVLGQYSNVQTGCAADPIGVLPDGYFVYCDMHNNVDVQQLPPYVLERAGSTGTFGTSPPVSFGTAPPNYVPQGAPTPAPTFAANLSRVFPDLSCLLNIQALYEPFASCVQWSALQLYGNASTDEHLLECGAAGTALASCVLTWLQGSECEGSEVYLYTALVNLNATERMGVCGSPQRCTDGSTGAASLCNAMNSLGAAGSMPVLPAAFLASVPSPVNTLPGFSGPRWPPASAPLQPAASKTGIIVGVAVGLFVVAVLAAIAFRVHRQRRQHVLNGTWLPGTLQEGEGAPPSITSLRESELGSLLSASDDRVSKEKQQKGGEKTYYSSV